MDAIVFLPRLRLVRRLSFLVDTGAETTMIGVRDAIDLGVDFNQLQFGLGLVVGVGGVVNQFNERALLSFPDTSGTTYVFERYIDINAPAAGTESIPSLLGRDIINGWSIRYRPVRNRLTAVVHDYDYTIARPTGTASPV
jgi:hypothetical protein